MVASEPSREPITERTTCLIVGGGPAGMMLGLLLARAGVQVTVLEKHSDFLRDFRGDTVHASTVRLMDELGLGPAFRSLPQSKLGNLVAPGPGGELVEIGAFDALKPPYNYVAMIPQWDLLDFLVDVAAREPTFSIRMNTRASGLIQSKGRVTGVTYRTGDGRTGQIQADLTVGCDGRHSILREQAGLVAREFRVPFDTWWFRLPRHEHERGEVAQLIPQFRGDEMLLTFVREHYYQVAYFTQKGADARLRAEGVEAFRARIARIRPEYADRLDAIKTMDDLHFLDVRMNRVPWRWHVDGLLLIGDAAHAASPAGGVGINLAMQDAVAAARLLVEPLRRGAPRSSDLARVRRRRLLPTVIVQQLQLLLHHTMFAPALAGRGFSAPRLLLFLGRRVPAFRKVPARLIAFGPRPEHAPSFARRPVA